MKKLPLGRHEGIHRGGIIAAALLVFVTAIAAASTQAHSKVIAYYFHGRVRCDSCRLIEAYSYEAVTGGFPKELADRRIEWRVVNIQEPGNEHFIDDFKLTAWSLVLVEEKDGKQARWRNLEKVWDLIGDRNKFTAYVQEEVGKFLRGEQA